MKSSRGFTLMEILVAVALLAMMGLIMTTATSSILGAIKDSRESQEQYHAARVALGRMERELSMAYLSKHQSELMTTKTAFLGKSNSVTFSYMGHRRMTRNAAESDEGFVTYRIEKDRKTGQNALIRREKPVIDDQPEKGGQRLVLATGVRKLTFAYWDFDKESWQADWKVEIDRAREAELKKSAAATAIGSQTGNMELGKALVGAAAQEQRHGPEELWLPARVKVTLVLDTEQGELTFETQTRIRLMQPIEFSGIQTPKPYENTLNPYAAIPAQTPAGFGVPAPGAGGLGGLGGGGLGGLPRP